MTEQVWSSADNTYTTQAVGDMCETDGTVMEVYSVLSKDEFVLSVKQDPQFKDGWNKVRGGLT